MSRDNLILAMIAVPALLFTESHAFAVNAHSSANAHAIVIHSDLTDTDHKDNRVPDCDDLLEYTEVSEGHYMGNPFEHDFPGSMGIAVTRVARGAHGQLFALTGSETIDNRVVRGICLDNPDNQHINGHESEGGVGYDVHAKRLVPTNSIVTTSGFGVDDVGFFHIPEPSTFMLSVCALPVLMFGRRGRFSGQRCGKPVRV